MNLGGSTAIYAARESDDDAFDFGSNDFAIQVWVNWNATAGEQVVIEKFSGSNGPGWTLTKLSGGEFQFYFLNGVAQSSVVAITTETWHQVLVNRSGGWLDVYLDTFNIIHSNIGTLSVADTENPLLIGKRNDGDGRGFATSGMMDETAIWSRSLTNDEIDSLYNQGAGMVLPEPTTIALFSFGILALVRNKK
jgi:hypothetical protein